MDFALLKHVVLNIPHKSKKKKKKSIKAYFRKVHLKQSF